MMTELNNFNDLSWRIYHESVSYKNRYMVAAFFTEFDARDWFDEQVPKDKGYCLIHVDAEGKQLEKWVK